MKTILNKSEGLPLTPAQLDIYLDQALQPNSPIYNVGGYVRIDNEVNLQAFELAHTQLIENNDVFHLGFYQNEDRIVQKYQFTASKFTYIEFMHNEDPEQAAREWVDQQLQKPFDLTQPGLYHAYLLKVNEVQYWYVPVAHHLITDGFGYSNWIDSLLRGYLSLVKNDNAIFKGQLTPFLDASVKETQYFSSGGFKRSTEFWDNVFVDKLHPILTQRYLDYKGEKSSFVVTKDIPQDKYQIFIQLSEQLGCRVHHLFLAALYSYFFSIQDNKSFTIGLPFHNRTGDAKKSIGCFASVSPLMVQGHSEMNFCDLMAMMQSNMQAMSKHKKYPLSTLFQNLRHKQPEITRLFDIQFNYQKLNYSYADDLLNTATYFIPPGHEQIPFIFNLCEFGEQQAVQLQVEANYQYFTPAEADLIFDRLINILNQVVQTPSVKLNQLVLTTESETSVYATLNELGNCDLTTNSVFDLFTHQVMADPERIALITSERKYTYLEIFNQSLQFARFLQEKGLKTHDKVALCLPREVELITSLLACLAIGVTYIPLDHKYPIERLQFMLDDSGAQLLLIGQEIDFNLGLTATEKFVWNKALVNQIQEYDPELQSSIQFDSNSTPAYIIYTSGSTGQPKGVVIPHSGLTNLLIAVKSSLNLDHTSNWLATTTVGFDIATVEIYGPLISGGRITLLDSEVSQHGEKLNAILATTEANLLQCTPAMWQMLLDAGWKNNPGLTAISGGEALTSTLAAQILSRSARLFNGYGPTEASVYSLFSQVTEADDCHLANPLPNYQHFILDEFDRVAPIGVSGELCIAGVGLAIEYLNQTELTNQQFVDYQTQQTSQRIYKTGDLVRLLPSGKIEYIGRLDHQVKVRGYRIELGEIENQLKSHPLIDDVIVDVKHNFNQEKIIVAYFISNSPAEQSQVSTRLRAHLSHKLPVFMLPHAFVKLEKFPITHNNKVDKKALPLPEFKSNAKVITAATAIEEKLVSIWQDLFNFKKVGTQDNFFELGGHSLMAMRMFGKIKQEFKIDLPLTVIFSYGDIQSLAAYITELDSDQKEQLNSDQIQVVKNKEHYSLSTAQQSMWLIDKLSNGANQYNMPGVFSLTGLLQPPALLMALKNLIERHQILRTMLIECGDEVRQEIINSPRFELPIEDLTDAGIDQQSKLQLLVETEANQVFNLRHELKLRAKLVKLSDEHHILLLTMHHIAADGWSINILSKELMALYQSALTGVAAELPELKVQYKDYAHWQQQRLEQGVLKEQLHYWKNQLKGIPKLHELALDHPRPANQSFAGDQFLQILPEDMCQNVSRFANAQRATPFMVLQAVYAALLSQWSSEEDIVMGTPVAGRQHPDVESLIGCFTNSIVLRNDINKKDNFLNILAKSRAMILTAFDNQDTPFEQLVEQLQPERNASYNPIFQIWIVLHNHEQQAFQLTDLNVEQIIQKEQHAKFDLALSITEIAGELHLEWQYCKDLFLPETIHRLADSFETLLSGVLNNPLEKIQNLPLIKGQVSDEPSQSMGVHRVYPQEYNLSQLIAQQSKVNPDGIAMVYQNESITYLELDLKANRLALRLIAQGVKANTPVGLCVDRSIGMLIGLLGILKSGGAYVPLDPGLPAERLTYIVSDTELARIVTTKSNRMLVPEHISQLTFLDEAHSPSWLNEFSNKVPVIDNNVSNLAYILYTSGSTGQPKGVAVSHKNLLNLTFSMREILANKGLDDHYKWAWNAPLVFDASVQALTQLAFGVELHLLSEKCRKTPPILLNYLDEFNIDVMDSTPALVELIVNEAEVNNQALPHLLIGGEAIKPLLWEKISHCQKRHNQFALNLYGPTECTVNASFADIDHTQPPNIGGGLPNTNIHLLNDELKQLPPGQVGEIYIGGAGVASGYYRNQALTNDRFIHSNIFGRLYKTGDLARWNKNGQLEYLGRTDFQVKLHGYRIELEEIEQVLLKFEGVTESVVLVKDSQLVAYVVADTGTENLLITHMKKYLPAYMVISKVFILKEIPLTLNGKHDRNALLALKVTDASVTYVAPETEIERKLQLIWQNLLSIKGISVEANFFEIGGHSLLAIRLASACREHFNTELPLTDFMASPSIRALAQKINQTLHNKSVFAHVENDVANLDKNERIVI